MARPRCSAELIPWACSGRAVVQTVWPPATCSLIRVLPRPFATHFEATSGELELRLLAALRAAEAAGGEAGPVRSAGISVVSGHGWRDTDLRVDWHEDPIAELERLLQVWLPQRQDYVIRGLDPASSVGYGVAGDERWQATALSPAVQRGNDRVLEAVTAQQPDLTRLSETLHANPELGWQEHRAAGVDR